MKELTISQVARMGGTSTFKKHGVAHYQSMAKKSSASRLGNLTAEERSEYFKKVRAGKSPKA